VRKSLGIACLLCAAAYGKTYEVGPQYGRKTLGAVPWDRLSAGDIVNLYPAASGCYAEKILLSTRGKSWERPVTVQGVLDDHGKRPCITGRNAVQAKSSSDRWSGPQAIYSQSLYVVAISLQAGADSGPAYIVLKNLEITGAETGGRYTDQDGVSRTYGKGVAGIRILNASHIRIENCWIHDIEGNGIFGKPMGGLPGAMADIQLLNNRIGGNGIEGEVFYHNTYIESDGSLYCGNLYEVERPGARGVHLKDRSAGTVIAHNYFDGNATRAIDLVEPQDGWEIFGLRPYYGYDFVFGNVFRIQGGIKNVRINTPIHYGGDQGRLRAYRKQTLNFYHNTFVVVADHSDLPLLTIFQPALAGQKLDLRNNIFAFLPRTEKGILPEIDLVNHSEDIVPAVTINMGVNWITSGWFACLPQGKNCFLGEIHGAENLISGTDPKFVDAAAGDFTLAAGSPAIGAGAPLSPVIAKNPQESDYTPTVQYAYEQHTTPRSSHGAGADLGAFALGAPWRTGGAAPLR
jgi:hypothetical protein